MHETLVIIAHVANVRQSMKIYRQASQFLYKNHIQTICVYNLADLLADVAIDNVTVESIL